MRFWSLALLSALCGIATMAVFSRAPGRYRAAESRKRLRAHLSELRLYATEPALIWRAQLAAMRASARLFLALWKPSLALALPMAWLLIQLDSVYGLASLPLNEPAVVTVRLAPPRNAAETASVLLAPPEIAVDEPPVRVLAEREIRWRIRPLSPVRGVLAVKLRGTSFSKSIRAGPGWAWLSPRRSRSLFTCLLHPLENRLPPGDADWIEVSYPEARVHLGGLEMPWLVWFFGFSTLGAMLSAPLLSRLERLFW
jgi:hypothetical protein